MQNWEQTFTGMKVYVAGPYTHPDPVVNTRNAILAGDELAQCGHIPWIPHLNIQWHMVCPHEPDFWYQYDLFWLDSCDAVLRLSGESTGADREVAFAKAKGIPVFSSVGQFLNYCSAIKTAKAVLP
jgi:nucleoside 2-deoxyribosyltransferase